jgi:hypothetical protein
LRYFMQPAIAAGGHLPQGFGSAISCVQNRIYLIRLRT